MWSKISWWLSYSNDDGHFKRKYRYRKRGSTRKELSHKPKCQMKCTWDTYLCNPLHIELHNDQSLALRKACKSLTTLYTFSIHLEDYETRLQLDLSEDEWSDTLESDTADKQDGAHPQDDNTCEEHCSKDHLGRRTSGQCRCRFCWNKCFDVTVSSEKSVLPQNHLFAGRQSGTSELSCTMNV